LSWPPLPLCSSGPATSRWRSGVRGEHPARACANRKCETQAVLGHLNTAAADIEHMAQKNPQIAARYAKVLAVVVQRREAIVAGMARAKASKATDPKKG
jgi:hypothetical protein